MEHHRKSHTSARQAGELATRAGAARLALHHLVPGTADPDVWLRAKETFAGELLVPNDLDIIEFQRPSPEIPPVITTTPQPLGDLNPSS